VYYVCRTICSKILSFLNTEVFLFNTVFKPYSVQCTVVVYFLLQDGSAALSEEQLCQLKQLQESKNFDDEVLIPVS